jgi:hypothetical protein
MLVSRTAQPQPLAVPGTHYAPTSSKRTVLACSWRCFLTAILEV